MEKYNPDTHNHRHSFRLQDYDYSQAGLYFVTICVQNRQCIFGEIVDDEMVLNDIGKSAEQCWAGIPLHFPNVNLHSFIVMPNHIHGIIQIVDANCNDIDCKGTACRAPTFEQFGKPIIGSIPTIIRSYKSAVTKQMHENGFIGRLWQRNYHEHVIRNEIAYQKIANYIENNHLNWNNDRYYIE